MNKKRLGKIFVFLLVMFMFSIDTVFAEGMCVRNIDSSKWTFDYTASVQESQVFDLENDGVSKQVCCKLGSGNNLKFYCDYYKPVTVKKEEKKTEVKATSNPLKYATAESFNCGIISDLRDPIRDIYGYLKIALPIALIIFGVIDFTTPILSNDKDALTKATSKFIKRCIIVVAFFFVPIILQFIFDAYNEATGKEISLCGLIGMIVRNWRL